MNVLVGTVRQGSKFSPSSACFLCVSAFKKVSPPGGRIATRLSQDASQSHVSLGSGPQGEVIIFIQAYPSGEF